MNIHNCTFRESEKGVQSELIDILRFPLAVMVVFAHTGVGNTNFEETGFQVFSVIQFILSFLLPRCAVPTFFLISGYLFFANVQEWSWNGYKKKIKSRVSSWIIPYFLWNALYYCLYVLALLVAVLLLNKHADTLQYSLNLWMHVFYDYGRFETEWQNWLGESVYMTCPFNVPLWFLRDLIVMAFISPIIYWMIKKNGYVFLIVLFFAYISRVWILLPGFSIRAIFFFSIGAYIALYNINLVDFISRYQKIAIPIFFVLMILSIYYNGGGTVIGQNIYPFFVISGVYMFFYSAVVAVTKYKLKPNKFLVSSCFFVYAFHLVGIPPIGSSIIISKRLLHYIIPWNSGIADFACYILTPFLSVTICICVFMTIQKLCPQLSMVLSGRIRKNI